MRRTSITWYSEYRKGPDGKRRRFYCVQWPRIGKGRHRQYFSDRQEARKLLEQKQSENAKFGVEHLAFSDRQRCEYAECVEMLRPFGEKLVDAVRYYVTRLRATTQSCTASELVEKVIDAKRGDGMSARYIQDLRSRLPRFAKDFDGKMVEEITPEEIGDWLRSLEVGPTTRNNFRRCLVMMFSYAAKRGYVTSNPAAKTEKAKEIDAVPGILTVQQMARLLDAAPPELLPYVAIGAFAGLRRAELERLDWSEIHFEENLIEVTSKKSKTSRRRFVKIQPNLREWLAPVRKHSGKVAPDNLETQLETAREAAALLADWPDNALRHSFASYHLAHFKDAAALALEMGHTDSGMIFNHYRQLVKPKEAERYWNIAPQAERSKVVDLTATS
jgi:integrase